MLDKKYYECYEGEGRVKIWRKEIGFVIWDGFFNAILEGCFKPDFQRIGNVAIEALILESFEKFNMGKRAKKHLHDGLVFALNKGEAYESDWDFVFVDYKNILGNGSNAIYMIGFKSKKLEEARYVAKDIVNLFRLFAQGAELNTTAIGKEK